MPQEDNRAKMIIAATLVGLASALTCLGLVSPGRLLGPQTRDYNLLFSRRYVRITRKENRVKTWPSRSK